MACLMCLHYQPQEPEDHRKAREAGACESHCGKEWIFGTARQYVREHEKNLDGWCNLNPSPVVRGSGHVCAQIAIIPHLLRYSGIRPWQNDQPLIEWAREQYQVLLYGTDAVQRENQLVETIAELKRQLGNSRRISASRLARLQQSAARKQPAKPAPEPAPERVPEPAIAAPAIAAPAITIPELAESRCIADRLMLEARAVSVDETV